MNNKLIMPRLFFTLTLQILFLQTGCSLPTSMQVRETNDPHYQDEDVRFRNTYYFRVYDYCMDKDSKIDNKTHQPFVSKKYTSILPPEPESPTKPPKTKGNKGKTATKENSENNSDHKDGAEHNANHKHVIADALYRFRVTGKADSLFTDIRFEAGTLQANEIDPFGARAAIECKTGTEGCNVVSPAQPALTPPTNGQTSTDSYSCDENGQAVRKGFQIIGPGGITEFDQDERLVIAMGTGVSPISTLKDLATHQKAERIAQGQGVGLALSQELARILNAKKELTQKPEHTGAKALKAAIAWLSQNSTQKKNTQE